MKNRSTIRSRDSAGAPAALATTLLLSVLLSCKANATGKPADAGSPASPAPPAQQAEPGKIVLRGGPTRTAEEILLCRKEESARAQKQPPVPVAPPAKPVRLRSAPVALPESGCLDAAKQWNFYTQENETRGCFVNVFRSYHRDTTLTLDLTTELAWEDYPGPKQYTFESAQQRIRELNDKKWNGFADWRLPTTEESLSILESSNFEPGACRLDRHFFVECGLFWTSNVTVGGVKHWVMRTRYGGCMSYSADYQFSVRVVRTMSKQELEKAQRDENELDERARKSRKL